MMSKIASLSSSTKAPIAKRTARTTIALPIELLEAADELVSLGFVRSRNELITGALRRELALLERLRIDTEFQAIANDPEYEREFRQIQAEFAGADRETLPRDESAGSDAPGR